LEEVVEKYDFDEGDTFIVSKSYGCGNVFSSGEGVHAIFQINISMRDMFRRDGAMRRGRGRCARHLVDSGLLDETFVEILGGLVVN
jgi:hypothetical protein